MSTLLEHPEKFHLEERLGPSIVTRRRHGGSLGCVAGNLQAVELPLGSVFSGQSEPEQKCPEQKHRILRRVLFAHRENIWKNRGYLILRWASVHRGHPGRTFYFEWDELKSENSFFFSSFLITLKNSI